MTWMHLLASTLNNAADYETQDSYDFILEADDGTTTVTKDIVVDINDVNEALFRYNNNSYSEKTKQMSK